MSLALATVSMEKETVGHNMLLGSSSSSSSCSGSSSSDDSMMVDEAINSEQTNSIKQGQSNGMID
jgi:hypothetical protein